MHAITITCTGNRFGRDSIYGTQIVAASESLIGSGKVKPRLQNEKIWHVPYIPTSTFCRQLSPFTCYILGTDVIHCHSTPDHTRDGLSSGLCFYAVKYNGYTATLKCRQDWSSLIRGRISRQPLV
jgi:hypothetical protein